MAPGVFRADRPAQGVAQARTARANQTAADTFARDRLGGTGRVSCPCTQPERISLRIQRASRPTGSRGRRYTDQRTGRNLYWLHTAGGGALDEDLHTVIVAADSRVHFMRPSSIDAIAYVLAEIRRLS